MTTKAGPISSQTRKSRSIGVRNLALVDNLLADAELEVDPTRVLDAFGPGLREWLTERRDLALEAARND